jgi:hypothetical protein
MGADMARLVGMRKAWGAALIAVVVSIGGIQDRPADTDSADAAPSTSTAGVMRELVELRTAQSRTYLRSDGTRVTHVFAAPVHFRDAVNAWQPVETELIPAADGYRNRANGFTVRLPQRLEGNPVRFEADGASLGFALRGADGTARVSGDRVRYDGALPGVDLVYTSGLTQLREELILHSPESTRAFTFDLAPSTGLRPQVEASGAVHVIDNHGNARLRLAPPVMIDAEGVPSDRIAVQLAQREGGWSLTLQPDQRWLDDPGRRWPVIIDPVVTRGAARDCTIAVSEGPTGYCSEATLPAGDRMVHPIHDSVEWRSMLRFDVASALPADAEVLNARLALYNTRGGSGDGTHGVHPLSQPWGEPPDQNLVGDGGPAADMISVGDSGPGFYHWNISQLVRDWVAGTQSNEGVLVRDDGLLNGCCWAEFASSEASDPSQRPHVELNYLPEQPPTLSLSGQLFDLAGQTVAPGSYEVTVSATDQPGSGVRRLELRVDDGLVAASEQQCPTGNCAMSRTFWLKHGELSCRSASH